MSTETPLKELKQLLEGINIIESAGDLSCSINSIAHDSRRVTPGALFVALPGENVDGMAYMEEAVRRGATAILSQSTCICSGDFPCVQVENARAALALISARLFDQPSEKLCTLGITGTNGKTTVSFMLREILVAAGRRPGLIGTVRYEIGDRVLPAARTTPESPDTQAMMAQMTRSNCDSVVMEVSSHALDQHRVAGMQFDAAVFTNLTQDHLDYHGTLEDYFHVKARLFKQLRGKAIVNLDDPWGKRLIDEYCQKENCICYGFDASAEVHGFDVKTGSNGSSMRVATPWGDTELSLQLIGRFNLHNALAAIAAAGSIGIAPDLSAKALSQMDCVPGRLEAVGGKRNKRVFVDYAHTHDALQNVLQALREITRERLIVVFGCGGNRDQGKRRLMGEVASRIADYAIITNDNPRNEIPEKIAADIATGFDSERKFEIILDRAEAIQRGVDLIGKKDILLVAGKGHETTQEFMGTIIPFDDRETVRDFM
jgi:UDP-N-acetylmuramoyl-L-alanyl-D-glutamate--2,6-diaminopimelate ligase